MKIQQVISLFVTFLFMLQGCYEDKGNYDYISSNELKITLNPINRKGFLGEPYIYYPEIEFLDKSDTMGFEYWWEYKGTSSEYTYDTLCLGRELNFIPTQTGYINMRLCVLELSTGVITSQDLQIQVESPYAKGWLILTEKEGRSALSFIRPGYEEIGSEKMRIYTPYQDIYQQLFPEDNLGQHPYRLKQILISGGCMVLLMQDNNPIYLDGNTYHKIMTMDKEFVEEVYPENFVVKDVFYGQGQDLLLSESGKLYSRSYRNYNFFSAAFANIPVEYDGKLLNIDQFIYTMPTLAQFMGLYDKENKRVLWAITWATEQGSIFSSNIMVPSDQSYVDLNDLDSYELIYGGSYGAAIVGGGGSATVIMLLKDQYGSIKLQKQLVQLAFPYPTIVDVMNIEEKDFSGSDYISDETIYYTLETRPYLFFATKNVLYWYDIETGKTKDFYYFQEGEEVVEMSSNPQESELGVLLKNGKFVILNIVNDKLYSSEKMYELSNLGTGVSLMYKYPDYTNYSNRTLSGIYTD